MTFDNSALVLERLRMQASTHLGLFALGRLTLQQMDDQLGGLVFKLATEVLATKTLGKRTYTFEHPASWWQHFKHTCAPRWFQRRWPPRMNTTQIVVDFAEYRAYPGANITPPPDQFGFPVQVEVAKYRVDSPWSYSVQNGPPPRYLTGTDLIRRLAHETHARLPDWGQALAPHQIEAVLAALQRLGVNTNELIPADHAQESPHV